MRDHGYTRSELSKASGRAARVERRRRRIAERMQRESLRAVEQRLSAEIGRSVSLLNAHTMSPAQAERAFRRLAGAWFRGLLRA